MLKYSAFHFKGFNSCSQWRCQTYIGAWNIILTCCTQQRPRTLPANVSANDTPSPETGPDTSCRLSSKGDNRPAMPDTIVREKKKNIINLSNAELAQGAIRIGVSACQLVSFDFQWQISPLNHQDQPFSRCTCVRCFKRTIVLQYLLLVQQRGIWCGVVQCEVAQYGSCVCACVRACVRAYVRLVRACVERYGSVVCVYRSIYACVRSCVCVGMFMYVYTIENRELGFMI